MNTSQHTLIDDVIFEKIVNKNVWAAQLNTVICCTTTLLIRRSYRK